MGLLDRTVRPRAAPPLAARSASRGQTSGKHEYRNRNWSCSSSARSSRSRSTCPTTVVSTCHLIGYILMAAGVVVFIIGLVFMLRKRQSITTVTQRRRRRRTRGRRARTATRPTSSGPLFGALDVWPNSSRRASQSLDGRAVCARAEYALNVSAYAGGSSLGEAQRARSSDSRRSQVTSRAAGCRAALDVVQRRDAGWLQRGELVERPSSRRPEIAARDDRAPVARTATARRSTNRS